MGGARAPAHGAHSGLFRANRERAQVVAMERGNLADCQPRPDRNREFWPPGHASKSGFLTLRLFLGRVMWQMMVAERHGSAAPIPASAQRRPMWSRKSGPGPA